MVKLRQVDHTELRGFVTASFMTGTGTKTEEDVSPVAYQPTSSGRDALGASRGALGDSLSLRSKDVAETTAITWRRACEGSSTWATSLNQQQIQHIEEEIRSVCAFATTALAEYLRTGIPTPPEQTRTWKGQGTLPLHGTIPLSELTKLNLYWRAATVEAIQEEGERLATDPAIITEAVDAARRM